MYNLFVIVVGVLHIWDFTHYAFLFIRISSKLFPTKFCILSNILNSNSVQHSFFFLSIVINLKNLTLKEKKRSKKQLSSSTSLYDHSVDKHLCVFAWDSYLGATEKFGSVYAHLHILRNLPQVFFLCNHFDCYFFWASLYCKFWYVEHFHTKFFW